MRTYFILLGAVLSASLYAGVSQQQRVDRTQPTATQVTFLRKEMMQSAANPDSLRRSALSARRESSIQS